MQCFIRQSDKLKLHFIAKIIILTKFVKRYVKATWNFELQMDILFVLPVQKQASIVWNEILQHILISTKNIF